MNLLLKIHIKMRLDVLKFFSFLKKKFFNSKDEPETLRGAIEDLIEENDESQDELDIEEKNLISNVLKLRDWNAHDLMVPRADITAVSTVMSRIEMLEQFSKSGHTRLPLYKDDLDDVIGFMHLKDITGENVKDEQLVQLKQNVLFVSPTMRALDLLLQMRLTRIPLAIVIDEFGGVDGLVTAHDIIEEIIGNLESDLLEPDNEITKLSDGSVIVNARMDIEHFEELFSLEVTDKEIEEEDVETIGGLVTYIAGRVPGSKEVITHPLGIEFEILEADPRRIKKMRVRMHNVNKDTSVNGN